MPKVGVVLLNYNYAKYLDERIQSLLNQTYNDFELLIIDNGSTDNSLEIINKYTKDERVKTCFYPNNKPPFKRLNEGLDRVQGDYLLIACSDDSCHPALIEKLVEKLDNYPSVGLAAAQSWNIDSEGKKLCSWREWTDDLNQERWSKDFVDKGKNECQYLFFKCTLPCASAVMLRRETFVEAGKFDIQMKFSADWMLWARMLMISDIAFIAEPLSYFRTHTSSARDTTRPIVELEERLQVIRYLAQEIQAPEYFWEKAYYPTVGWWMRLVFSQKTSIAQNLRIYKLLKSINPRINYFVAKNFLGMFKRKILIAN